MDTVQQGILAPIPRLARYLTFSLRPGSDPRVCLSAAARAMGGETTVVGLGLSLVMTLGRDIAGLRSFPEQVGAGIEVPSTPAALWCWLRGGDRGELVHWTRLLEDQLSPAFRLETVIDAFQFGASLDLTGYEDGTENPQGEDATAAAVVTDAPGGLAGSSFVAVQQWEHDLRCFAAMSPDEQDLTFGRRKRDNEEIDDAPPSAHVKRTAQESFDPEAFVLRRSMPWTDGKRAGLVFVAFGKSFDAFESLLKRMVGGEDGVTDALFRFTRPVSGSYYWCPPVRNGHVDLAALDL